MNTRTWMAAVAVGWVLGISGPAAATAQISCRAVDDEASGFDLTIGSVPGFALVNFYGTGFGKSWAMHATDDDIEVSIAQAAQDGGWIIVDMVDTNFEQILVSIRLHEASEADSFATAGTMRVAGEGVLAVVCDGS